MNQTMTYDKLYSNMVKKFTVEYNKTDYTLGDYMLMKANAKKNALVSSGNNLPAVNGKSNAITTVFSYVNDKLTVKEAPIRNKTLRSFPLRTSISAFCSALVVCALVVSCCIFGMSMNANGEDNIVKTEEPEKDYTENGEDTAFASVEFK